MDALATRGHVILDDDQVRLRTSTTSAQRFTQLFALKSDESSVSTRFADRPTASEVTTEITAAIDALKGDAPDLMDTLGEIADALADDEDVYNSLVALINARQPLLSIPSAAGLSLLSGTNLRRLEVTGNASLTDNTTHVTLDVSGVSAATFASHQTSVATSLGQKQDTLSSGGGTGVEILTGNVVRRIRLYGNVSTTSDADEVLVNIQGRNDTQIDALLNAKQNLLSNNSGSTGEELLTGTTLRKIRAGTNVTLSLVDGDLNIASTGGVSASDVATSIAAAVSAYTLTSTLTTQLAAKQDNLTSAGGTGNAILDSNVIKRIDFDGDFAISDNGSKITVSLSSALSTKQDTLSNYSVSGFELFSSNKLKRINVPLNLSLGVPLQMAENTSGELTLTSNSYAYTQVDTLLAGKQAALSVSSVSGSTLLNGTILKRIAAGTGLSIADSGHALTLTVDLSSKQDALSLNASASGQPVIDMDHDIVRKLDTAGDNIVTISQANSGATLRFTCDGYTKSQITTYLAAKQDTLTNWGTGVDLLYNGALRGLSVSGPLGVAFAQNFNEIILTCNSYTKQESDANYVAQDPQSITFMNSNGPELNVIARSSRSELEYKGGMLRIRREASGGSFSSHCQFPDSTNGNTFFHNSITADSFATSDSRLKDNQEEVTADEALGILQAVTPKKYTRNDKDNEPRHGFIAQELETAIKGKDNFQCLVGTTDQIIDDDDQQIEALKTVDYARLTAILWTCVRDLHSKVQDLQNASA